MWRNLAAIAVTTLSMLAWGLNDAKGQGRFGEILDSAAERQAGINGARFGRDHYGRYTTGYRGTFNAGYSPAYRRGYNVGYVGPSYSTYGPVHYSTYYRGPAAVQPQSAGYPSSAACYCH